MRGGIAPAAMVAFLLAAQPGSAACHLVLYNATHADLNITVFDFDPPNDRTSDETFVPATSARDISTTLATCAGPILLWVLRPADQSKYRFVAQQTVGNLPHYTVHSGDLSNGAKVAG